MDDPPDICRPGSGQQRIECRKVGRPRRPRIISQIEEHILSFKALGQGPGILQPPDHGLHRRAMLACSNRLGPDQHSDVGTGINQMLDQSLADEPVCPCDRNAPICQMFSQFGWYQCLCPACPNGLPAFQSPSAINQGVTTQRGIIVSVSPTGVSMGDRISRNPLNLPGLIQSETTEIHAAFRAAGSSGLKCPVILALRAGRVP